MHATTLQGIKKYPGESDSVSEVSEGQGQIAVVQAKAAPQSKTLESHPAPLHSLASHPETAPAHTQTSSSILLFYLQFFL